MSEQLQASTATSTSETTPTTSSAFSTKSILSQSIYKSERLLPTSLPDKAKVIGILVKKFNLRIAVHKKSGREKNELSEEEK